MNRKIIVETIATVFSAMLSVTAVILGALLLRVVWEGILLGWTGFGYWP